MESDFHIHSLFSDWLNTIDEIVKYAWEIWLKKIAITDHSDATMKKYKEKFWIYQSYSKYIFDIAWKNIWNDVEVVFWVEADLLNKNWDVCFTIQWIESEFNILALHKWLYEDDYNSITEWFINAIEKYHDKIDLIAHLDDVFQWAEYVDIEKIVNCANKYNIPFEFNAYTFINWNSDEKKLRYILDNANEIYINSDAHSLYQLRDYRKIVFDYLKENWYL